MAKAQSISRMGALKSFVREAKAELKKVAWPTKRQVWYWTLVVIVFTLCVSVYLGVIDFVLAWFFTWLLG